MWLKKIDGIYIENLIMVGVSGLKVEGKRNVLNFMDDCEYVWNIHNLHVMVTSQQISVSNFILRGCAIERQYITRVINMVTMANVIRVWTTTNHAGRPIVTP